jgi:hypothetical protein
MERDFQRVVSDGAPLSFIYPRPCANGLDTVQGCAPGWPLGWRGADGTESAAFQLVAGEEYRQGVYSRWATDGGLVAVGAKGPLSFALDARLLMERRQPGDSGSTDGEAMDFQDADVSGISYVSFARYRGDVDLDLPFGRFTAGRDAIHWGPGLFTNFVFNQEAIPFHYLAYTAQLGPFSIISLYGDLLEGNGMPTGGSRNLYAHRYEWRIGKDLLLGYSEQLILGSRNKPYLFTPIFPLFIAKGFMEENDNNGNLALDVSYRFGKTALMYSEFFLDDLESPGSLLTSDYRQNKWAWRAGAQIAAQWKGMSPGAILEYSRLEPWVYTHFEGSNAQTANLGRPLGNPYGPNSQALVAKAFCRFPVGLYLGLGASAVWKGKDMGSDISDPYDGRRHLDSKAFLADADRAFTLSPEAAFPWRWFTAQGRLDLDENFRASARIEARY